MKGGWAGAKVASASEEPGDARRTPVTSRRYGGERPHPRGGDGRDRSCRSLGARSAPFRAQSRFPTKGKFAPCRVSTMQNQRASPRSA